MKPFCPMKLIVADDVSNWPHLPALDRRRILEHMQRCNGEGVLMIAHMNSEQEDKRSEHSTVQRDGMKYHNRVELAVMNRSGNYHVVIRSRKNFTNESLYRTILQIYRKKLGLPAVFIPAVASETRDQQCLNYSKYMGWILDFRRFSMEEPSIQLEASLNDELDCQIKKCILCNGENLVPLRRELPLVLLRSSRCIAITKSKCVDCNFIHHQHDIRFGCVEINGTAYSNDFLNHLNIGFKESGQFSSVFRTEDKIRGIHVAENEALIACRFWQEIVKEEIIACSECGPSPEILFADVSGKRK
jgi:hypothetical protein